MIYTNPIIGRWLDEAGHPEARSWAIGPAPILDGEGNPVLDESGEPTYEDGPDRYEVRGWNEAWGELPTEEYLATWEAPTPTPAPVDIGKVFAEAYAAAPLALNALKQAVWTARVMAGTDPATATAEGVALVLRFGPELSAYKDAGGHPIAAAALYAAISSQESVAALPWLSPAILAIFAAALVPQ